MVVRLLNYLGLLILIDVYTGALESYQYNIMPPLPLNAYYRHMVPGQRIIITDKDANTGYIMSPGYPSPFPRNSSSNVVLKNQLNPTTSVRLTFEDLDIEISSFCKNEAVTFHCGLRYRPIFTACGSTLPNDIVLDDCIEVRISFNSDDFDTSHNRGFMVRYEFLAQSYINSSYLCNQDTHFVCRNRLCIAKHLRCNQVDDCGDASDEDSSTPCAKLPTIQYPIDYACGLSGLLSPSSMDELGNRIVGGNIVRRAGSWPHQVSIQSTNYESVSQICGATLIHPLYVLSAAHCFREPYKFIKFIFGAKDLKTDSKPDINNHVQVRYLSNVNFFPSPNDIALVELNAPIQLTPYVWPACLPHEHETIMANSQCYTTGFGSTRGSGGTLALKRVTQTVRYASECQAPYNKILCLDDYSMICAEANQGDGVCHGDSGGSLMCPDDPSINIDDTSPIGRYQPARSLPLMSSETYNRTKEILRKPTRFTVYGVLSHIAGGNGGHAYCGFANVPTIYTRVSVFTEWILSLMFRDIRYSSNKKDRDQLKANRSLHFGYLFRSGLSRHPNFTKPMTILPESQLKQPKTLVGRCS